MDQATIRKQLVEFRARLEQIDAERTAIQGIVSGYETLLRTMGESEPARSEPARRATATSPRKFHGSTPVGSVSMRSAVADVLRRADRPLHTKQVLDQAMQMGAASNSKDPASVVDLVILNLSKKGLVKKTEPRTWRWISTPERPSD
jgi:hypothetical protein